MFEEKIAYAAILIGVIFTFISLLTSSGGTFFDVDFGLPQNGMANVLYAAVLVSVAISIIISRIYKKEIKNYYKYSKKDILLFSVLALYFLLVIMYNGFFYSVNSFSAMEEKCENNYIGRVYYNPSQKELWPGQWQEAMGINSLIKSSCYSSNAMITVAILFAGFIGFMIFAPMAIITFAELLLLVLAVLGIKNVYLIKKLLKIDLIANKILFRMHYDKYPLNQNNSPFYSVDDLNRRYEEEKYKLDEYHRSIEAATKDNLSILYKKVEAMFVLLIIASYALNTYLIMSDSASLLGGNFSLSFSLAVSILIFIVYISKILILLLNYNKEYAIEFFQQESRGDKIFLFCIIFVILINSLFLSLSFVEMFGILYITSYLFDTIYNKIVYKDI